MKVLTVIIRWNIPGQALSCTEKGKCKIEPPFLEENEEIVTEKLQTSRRLPCSNCRTLEASPNTCQRRKTQFEVPGGVPDFEDAKLRRMQIPDIKGQFLLYFECFHVAEHIFVSIHSSALAGMFWQLKRNEENY